MSIVTLECPYEFHLVRLLAQGGMGSVYEAEQHGAAGFIKTVAIKMIRRRLAADEDFIRLFISEAKLVADLVHENIVQVYSLSVSAGEHFIVMEYVDGLTLEDFIRHHVSTGMPLPIQLGAFVVSRVCRGLEYAHRKRGRDGKELGIVHRDISPKNVLLNYEGVVKITDFGIAKAWKVMEQDEGVLMGRLEYMAPEQARRDVTDRRSDIYSLGVVMYELLTGQLPARGAGSLQRLHEMGMAYARPPQDVRPELPDDLCTTLARALEPDPADRYQTAGEMGYALEYSLYHGGYGPTNLTLGEYLRLHFPRTGAYLEDQGPTTVRREAQQVEQRAETAFGKLLEKEKKPEKDPGP